MDTDKADYYRGEYGQQYVGPTAGTSRITIKTLPVLPELNGKPYDNMALNFIHSVRPSSIRVSEFGEYCLSSSKWRVTVFLVPGSNVINRIEQEVEVAMHGLQPGSDIRSYM